MKKLLIPILALLIASPAWSAQQNISTITTKTSREALRTAVNTELGKVQSNTTELYSLAIAAPWLAQGTAPSITNVFWVDTSGASPVIKYWDGDSWEVAASGGDGTYTLPVATSSVLGGVKQGAGTSIAVDGTISVTAAGIGLGTTDNAVFGSVNASGGTLSAGVANTTQGTLVLYTNTDPIYGFSLAPAASPSASVSLKAPAGMPSVDNSLLNFDINGTGGWTDPATFLTPSGIGGALTVTATGFDGNLTTSDNTLQEIAQKVDDLVLGSGGGYSNLTEFVAQTAWRLFYSDGSGDVKELALGSDGEYLKSNGAALAPSWATPSGAAHDAITLGTDADAVLGLSTQQITLDSQTANYFFAAPNGSAGDPTFRAIVAADIPTLNQNTTGSAATLTTARTIGGVSFDGSANINLPGVNASGTQNTSGTAAGLTAQYIDWNSASGGSSIANKPTIPTASSLSVDDLITLSGVATGAVNLGTFTGATIADSSTVKAAIQSVETAVETKANASSIAFEAATWSDLKILDTTHTTAGTGIALVQDSMAYANADDAYHLWSIDKVGSELAGKQAADADLTDLADGSLTGSKVGFADTDGLWTASNIEAALVEMNDSINAGVPNGTGAKVHWSQLLGVPAGFADGSDDGAGGTPTAITVADTTDTTSYVALFTDATGDLGPKTDAGLTYNATTGMLTATGLTGPLTGTASGNLISGGAIGAATATTPAANDNDTSVATTAYVQTEIAATASDSLTLTNKTLDTAGTGNAITVPLNGVLDGAITDPADADDMIYKKVQNAMTLTDIHCLAEGGGTITLTLQECTSAGASCANIETAITCDADGAEDDGTLSDASIAAGAWIKVLYSAPTGTVNNVAWTVYGTQTW